MNNNDLKSPPKLSQGDDAHQKDRDFFTNHEFASLEQSNKGTDALKVSSRVINTIENIENLMKIAKQTLDQQPAIDLKADVFKSVSSYITGKDSEKEATDHFKHIYQNQVKVLQNKE